jgi:hypothetical protein
MPLNPDRPEPQYELPRYLHPYWWRFDPAPPWLKLDEDDLRRFAEMEVRFQLRELELQQEKLQELSKIMKIGK